VKHENWIHQQNLKAKKLEQSRANPELMIKPINLPYIMYHLQKFTLWYIFTAEIKIGLRKISKNNGSI
jgi:hypothetical protein